jgi:hypothetical protein
MIERTEIAFVDPGIDDIDEFLSGLRPDVDAAVLGALDAPAAQISAALKSRTALTAVHIVAHGAPGEVSLAGRPLSLETLDGNANDLSSIGQALAAGGGLLLWTCNTGQGRRGSAFIAQLSRIASADVSAAAGLVGSPARGARWELDVGANGTGANPPLTAAGMASYRGVMKLSVTWLPGSKTGTESGPIPLGTILFHGAAGSSLRSAIISGIPVGATITDGHGHSFTATTGKTSADITTWALPKLTLSKLSIIPPNDVNFSLTVTGTDLGGNVARAIETVVVNPLAPTLAPVAATGIEGSAITLNLGATVTSRSGDTNRLTSLVVSAIPVGAVLSDGTNTFKSTSRNTSVEVVTWNLSSLTITPANDKNFTLTVSATELDAEGNLSATTKAAEKLTVLPTAPVLSWSASVSGVEGAAIPLGNLAGTVTGKSGDKNSLSTLTISGAPAGAVLSDGHGHSHASSGVADVIDVSRWTLSSLTITPTSNASFTLTAAVTEKDAEGDSSPTATATEAIIFKPAAPVIASFSPDTGVQGDGLTSGNSAHAITLAGTADAGTTVTVYDGSTSVGKTTAAADRSWSLPTPALSDGTHSFTATATNAHRDSSIPSAAFAVRIDTTPPSLTPVANQTEEAMSAAGAPASFAATATDLVDGTDPVVFKEGNATVHSGDTFSLGTHTITASATDAAGNTASETFAIKVVSSAGPTIAINPINGNDVLNSLEAQQDLVIGGTSSGVAGQTVTVTLNGVQYTGQVNTDGSWSVTVPKAALASAALPDGSYLVTADVKDQNGNAAPQATLALGVHETLPTIATNPIDGNDVLNATEAEHPLAITGTSTGAVDRTVTVILNGVAYTGQVASDGTWSVTVPVAALATALLPDGTYKVTADLTDQYGNAAIEASRTLAVHETPPAAPTFDLSKADQTGPAGSHETSSAVVTLVGQTGAGDTVQLTSTGQTTIANTSGAFQFTNVNLAQGANALTVQATDAAGNTSTYSLTVDRLAPTGSADAAVQWNQIALQAIKTDAAMPTFASRALAMESLAVFDAVSAVDGTPGYLLNMTTPAGADANAAAAQAAHDVLAYLFPTQKATFDAALASALAAIPDGQGKTDGVALGQAVAAKIITLRANDGWDANVIDDGSTAVGQWRPTAPAYMPAADPQWANLTPFALLSPNQFLPAGPPDLSSQAYADAVNLTESLGAANSTTRTADQTQIANFWKDGAGTFTPAGHWNSIADQVAQAQGDSLAADARMFAELNVALGDAAIAAWNTKYDYNTWRPITVIQNANSFTNAGITQNPNWQPLIITPNFPEYVSGHSTYSAAAAEVLSSFFGNNYPKSGSCPNIRLKSNENSSFP